MKKILIVTKDVSEFNNYQNVVRRLKLSSGTIVIPEGLSLKKWHDMKKLQETNSISAWHRPFVWGPPAEEMYEKNTQMRHDIDPVCLLANIQPDVVMTGLASPINLGETFGKAANMFGIPLGYIEDLWGVHTRSKAKPDFVCTVDAYGQMLVEKYYDGKTKCFVTGAPSDDALLSVETHSAVEEVVKKTPYTVLVAGQDHSTTPLLQGLISALEEIGGYTIIPRFHPKWLAVTEDTIAAETDPEKKKTAEGILNACTTWRNMLSGVRGNVWWAPAEITTHQIMKSVPYVVSIYSNVLREAGILGAVPVSWTSDVGRDMMRKHLGGLEQYPLVRYGAVLEIETSADWHTRVPRVVDRDHIRSYFNADGKNTERVVSAIEQYL